MGHYLRAEDRSAPPLSLSFGSPSTRVSCRCQHINIAISGYVSVQHVSLEDTCPIQMAALMGMLLFVAVCRGKRNLVSRPSCLDDGVTEDTEHDNISLPPLKTKSSPPKLDPPLITGTNSVLRGTGWLHPGLEGMMGSKAEGVEEMGE
eukprot:1175856-Amorphochlora_amoeboformis.AAC.2